jgi:acyl-[acyl-carrier-protein]-phospholipid O-acyltransferase/long-chain-fatty-acid--[acyl-carrier-protein] ligase
MVGRNGDELVLAGRHRGVVAAAALIKTLIGGNEYTVTAYLAVFSIAVGVGSGLAAAIARGQIVLKTTLVGAVLLGGFALDLGVATLDATPATSLQGPSVVFASALGIRVAADLCGLAIGGLFIVPTFAAVQAWSGADYRARTIAAVNVLNAAFMTNGAIIVAPCRNSVQQYQCFSCRLA